VSGHPVPLSKVTFIDKLGESHTFEVSDGSNLLDIAQENDLEVEGACGGSCACSTCHVIITDQDMYDRIPEPSDDENDMLDLAFGLTETSRLGCQVQITKELDGLTIKLPQAMRLMLNFSISRITVTYHQRSFTMYRYRHIGWLSSYYSSILHSIPSILSKYHGTSNHQHVLKGTLGDY
jgi:ferredoxin